MDVILIPIYNVIDTLLFLYSWVLVFTIILSWLLSFGVVNSHNPFVSTLGVFLFKVTEPLLQPIRKLLPNFGGIDVSPVLLFLAIYFVRDVLSRLVEKII